jgi:hypothetical protein
MPSVIGIDTGANGAAVYILDGVMGDTYIEVLKFGAKAFSRRVLYLWLLDRSHATAYIEKVSPHPATGKDGKPRKVGTKSMFTMGANYERPMMALAAIGVEPIEISARSWQKGLGISWPKGTEYGERKQLLFEKAQELFPETRITKATADAYLIAEFARQFERRI